MREHGGGRCVPAEADQTPLHEAARHLGPTKIYVHIDMDVLDPREVMGHVNKVPNGPSSEELARRFEEIFRRYGKASAIGSRRFPRPARAGCRLPR